MAVNTVPAFQHRHHATVAMAIRDPDDVLGEPLIIRFLQLHVAMVQLVATTAFQDYEADEAYDLWSFGVVLVQLCLTWLLSVCVVIISLHNLSFQHCRAS